MNEMELQAAFSACPEHASLHARMEGPAVLGVTGHAYSYIDWRHADTTSSRHHGFEQACKYLMVLVLVRADMRRFRAWLGRGGRGALADLHVMWMMGMVPER